MLFLFTILAVLAAAGVIAYFSQRRSQQKLSESNIYIDLERENLRPLFQPTDEDLRLAATAEEAQKHAGDLEGTRREHEKNLAKLDELRKTWLDSSNRTNTIELLYRASQSESGEAYSTTALSVIENWRAGKIADMTSVDMAQLLESHFWLLPADERTPGVTFRLNSEIADLRRASLENK